MKKLIILFVFVFLQNISAQNTAPVVTNVTFAERTDSSFIVDINYDVTDAENDTMTVTMLVSTDAGQNWGFSANNITGDVGAGILSGTGKHIVWNFGAEHPQFFSDQVKVRIEVDDNVDTTACPGIPTVTYGGKTYHTVQIGSQCWLKENLDVGTQINDDYGNNDQTDNGVIEKYCYDNDPANCDIYGGLYQWNEAMQYVTTEGAQGICPNGWHIPSKTEYQTLINTVNSDGDALKEIGQGYQFGAGTNTSGFSALLAGIYVGSFAFLGQGTLFWSSTWFSNYDEVYYNGLHDSNAVIETGITGKELGMSIRCIKD